MLAMALTGSVCLASEAPLTFSDLFGRWKVQEEVGSATITAGETEEKRPLGTTITITAEEIITPWRPPPCRPQSTDMKFVDTKTELEQNWRVTISGLHLPRGRVKPQMQLMDAGCAVALVLDRNTLLWSSGEGFNYIATRQRR